MWGRPAAQDVVEGTFPLVGPEQRENVLARERQEVHLEGGHVIPVVAFFQREATRELAGERHVQGRVGRV